MGSGIGQKIVGHCTTLISFGCANYARGHAPGEASGLRRARLFRAAVRRWQGCLPVVQGETRGSAVWRGLKLTPAATRREMTGERPGPVHGFPDIKRGHHLTFCPGQERRQMRLPFWVF
jgi:hypothetical protein